MTDPDGARSGNLYGMSLMLAVTFVVIGQHSLVKYLSGELHTFEIVFFRTATALVLNRQRALLMAESLKQGETQVVTTFDFFRPIWVALIGDFLFDELPDKFTWLGGQ